jgi:hypothetical protein
MQITSILDACQSILEEQDEPQSSYWLASQMMEMRLWRASEADVRDALAKELEERGESSRFMRVAEDEFALRSWIKEMGAVEYQPTSDIEEQFPAVAKWVRSYGWIEVGSEQSFGFVVRALDDGGLICENEDCSSLVDAMAALETGLAAWFKDNA